MLGAPVAGSLFLNAKKQMWFPAASSLWFNKPLAMVASLSSSSSSSSTATTSASPLQEAAASIPAIPKVVLKKGKTQLFRNGSPMVYSGAVDRIVGRPPPKTGDMVLVTDGSQKPIGWGLYNSVSMFCVRIMQLEDDARRDPSCVLNMERLLETRLEAAVNLRKCLGLPGEDTNAFRLVNSEGDRLSGLVVDVFNDCAVVASSAAWVEKYRLTIELLLGKVNMINHTCWRPSVDILKEEGLDLEANNHPLYDDRIKVKENGIYYTVSLDGQKTGFYADQRESRSLVSKISKNQRVLDLCCYSGGFALNAASGGAAAVVGIDSSLAAIELAKENILLNSLDPERISFLKEDAAEFMKNAASKKDSWDLVILDPPKLAPNRKVLQRASGMYRSLNCLAMRVTREGGLLMTCSCSGAMTQSGTFLQVLQTGFGRGRLLRSVQIYMNEAKVAEEQAWQHIRSLLRDAWRRLNSQLLSPQQQRQQASFSRAQQNGAYHVGYSYFCFTERQSELIYDPFQNTSEWWAPMCVFDELYVEFKRSDFINCCI